MRTVFQKLMLVTGFAIGGLALATAADEKKTDDKPPDFSAYATKGLTVLGEVVKVSRDTVTVKVPKAGKGRNAYDEMDWQFAEGGLVRWDKVPTKTDDKGKKVQPTAKELAALKTPKGVPGYAAERDELQAGHLVKLELIRPKEIVEKKALPQDYKIKYVTIMGVSAAPLMK